MGELSLSLKERTVLNRETKNINTSVNLENEVKTNCIDRSNIKKRKSFLFKAIKRTFDIAFSVLALIVCAPILLVVCIIIPIDSKGSAFYAHKRVGYNGNDFKMLKLRSMYSQTDNHQVQLSDEQIEMLKKEYKLREDPRITRIGRFIRKTSIDEIPQFINIIKGDMSLVGPRPLVEDELTFYEGKKELLLSVKPGLTGYWQAYARNDATYQSGERQKMELFYVENQGVLLDIKIILKTVGTILKKNGC